MIIPDSGGHRLLPRGIAVGGRLRRVRLTPPPWTNGAFACSPYARSGRLNKHLSATALQLVRSAQQAQTTEGDADFPPLRAGCLLGASPSSGAGRAEATLGGFRVGCKGIPAQEVTRIQQALPHRAIKMSCIFCRHWSWRIPLAKVDFPLRFLADSPYVDFIQNTASVRVWDGQGTRSHANSRTRPHKILKLALGLGLGLGLQLQSQG